MERKIVILEWRSIDYDMKGLPAITQSEFRRRIDAVIELRVKGGGVNWTWERAENIMLGKADPPRAVRERI